MSKAELQRQAKVRRMTAPEAAPKRMAVRKNSTHKRMGRVAPAEKHGKARKIGKLKFKKAKKGKTSGMILLSSLKERAHSPDQQIRNRLLVLVSES